MDWKILLAFGGWLLAIFQFILNFKEAKRKNEAELLEKTLGYFERGILARSIGISLVEGVWLERKKNIPVILPVLVSQATFLLSNADPHEPERRNTVRLLYLIEKCLPHSDNSEFERAEVLEALLRGSQLENCIFSPITLKAWYKRFNDGDISIFEAELSDF